MCRNDTSTDGIEREPGQACPNPDCHIDKRWPGFRGLCCPECAARLVVACEECDSGAVEEVDGSPLCSDHAPELVTDGGRPQDGTERLERVHDGERISVLKTIGEQSKDLNGIERSVTCPCGTQRNVRCMFQCLYCEVWFCQNCAEDHFGDRSVNSDMDQSK